MIAEYEFETGESKAPENTMRRNTIREGSQKKCKSMVFDQSGGGGSRNQTLIAKFVFIEKRVLFKGF